ncbi:MAG: hypothetical protein K2F83_06710 [Oscillospiraceae bacterium]|nr:hypothetical protein [Oscillospiraceae bacterium]
MTVKKIWRGTLYVAGLLILALGLTLNNKCALGTSALSTTPYFASLVWGANFGDAMFLVYALCVALQLVLNPKGHKIQALAQLPVSLVFSRVLNWMDVIIMEPAALWGKVLMLVGAILLTGIGAAMCLNARLIPSPGDGIVDSLARFFGKEIGLMKNLFDFFCMAVTFVLGIATGHFMCALGIGTLVGVVGVGRVMSLYNALFQKPQNRLMGVE